MPRYGPRGVRPSQVILVRFFFEDADEELQTDGQGVGIPAATC